MLRRPTGFVDTQTGRTDDRRIVKDLRPPEKESGYESRVSVSPFEEMDRLLESQELETVSEGRTESEPSAVSEGKTESEPSVLETPELESVESSSEIVVSEESLSTVELPLDTIFTDEMERELCCLELVTPSKLLGSDRERLSLLQQLSRKSEERRRLERSAGFLSDFAPLMESISSTPVVDYESLEIELMLDSDCVIPSDPTPLDFKRLISKVQRSMTRVASLYIQSKKRVQLIDTGIEALQRVWMSRSDASSENRAIGELSSQLPEIYERQRQEQTFYKLCSLSWMAHTAQMEAIKLMVSVVRDESIMSGPVQSATSVRETGRSIPLSGQTQIDFDEV